MNNGVIIEEELKIISEDKNTEFCIIKTSTGLIFQVLKMESNPKILLLTLKSLVAKIKELKEDYVYNFVGEEEINMFNKKEIEHTSSEGILIKIKTNDLFDELVTVFGIKDLVLNI
jgi:hypothetical protein